MGRLRKMYDDKRSQLSEAEERIAVLEEHNKSREETYDVMVDRLKDWKADYARLEAKHDALVNGVAATDPFQHATDRAEKIARDYGGYAGYKKVATLIADEIGKVREG